jgi:hypothetical protein
VKGKLRLAAILASAIAVSGAALAKDGDCFCRMTSAQISRALKKIHSENPGSDERALQSRMTQVSAYFLGTPYRLGPLGEGPTGEFSRLPLESFQAVDCTTLVEETMALSLEPDLDRALSVLQKIRYRGGQIVYFSRNHFPEADWIPNNIKAGYLADITRQVAGDKTRTARKIISKKNWYSAKTEADLAGLGDLSAAQRHQLLLRLRSLAEKVPDQAAELDYLPIKDLPAVIDQIPSGTIANLVRADDPKAPASSQSTMVTHQVLLVVKYGRTYVRHAAYGKQVEDVPALDYFKRYEYSKRKLLGLNLLELRKPN